MKSVLLSVRPIFCKFITSRKKKIELRKTRPKIAPPFKCYIYCTKSKNLYGDFGVNGKPVPCGGMVIGEFVCEKIDFYSAVAFCIKEDADKTIFGSCLSYEEIKKYLGWKSGENRYDCNPFYGWHISDLVIYDKPKELSDFGLKRPPQSWCYVEEVNVLC